MTECPILAYANNAFDLAMEEEYPEGSMGKSIDILNFFLSVFMLNDLCFICYMNSATYPRK